MFEAMFFIKFAIVDDPFAFRVDFDQKAGLPFLDDKYMIVVEIYSDSLQSFVLIRMSKLHRNLIIVLQGCKRNLLDFLPDKDVKLND